MARTKEYRHYCPGARALEVIGEKWSLLIVRDLLPGPQRFTDLLHSLGGISPKWLTARLRELEEAGIVVRDQEAGRREVRYGLTPKGRDLQPVLQALVAWGLDHGRPPEPGEPVSPQRPGGGTVILLNRRGVRLPEPATWLLRLTPDHASALRFDGARWSLDPGQGQADADVRVETSPEVWMRFCMVAPAERERLLAEMRIEGEPERTEEFKAAFGLGVAVAA